MAGQDPASLSPPQVRLTCKLRSRGRYQLELKLHYPLRPVSRQIFQTDVYVFAPGKLDLTAQSYGVRRVLQELVLLQRHSSPRIALADMLRPDVERSPLCRLKAMVETGTLRGQAAAAVRELKTLVNAYRAEARSAVSGARRSIARGDAAASTTIQGALELITALPAAARDLRRRIGKLDPEPAVAHALQWADEGLSVILASGLFRMLDALRAHRGFRREAGGAREALSAEMAYRELRGMDLRPRPGPSMEAQAHNEGVLLRIRELKRWSQSALYLTKRMRKENARVGQIAAGTAAALAMSFAVVASAFAQEHFAMYSLPWAFIVVLSYILKDRIKEIVRAIIGAMIPRLLSDRSHGVVDPTGRLAGITRETVFFTTSERLPAEVRDLRVRAPAVVAGLAGDPEPDESVIHYRKWMRTRSRVLLRDHRRLERLTALIRWGVEGWLQEMDEAHALLRSVEDGKEVRAPARRVYHVHLAVRVREEGAACAPALFLYRIALSRDGIARTVRLSATPPPIASL